MPSFDTLAAAQHLQQGDVFSPAQAEKLVSMVDRAISTGVATKADLDMTRSAFQTDLEAAKHSLETKIDRLDDRINRLDAKIDHVELRLLARIVSGEERLAAAIEKASLTSTVRLGSIVVAAAAVVAALQRFAH